MTALASLAQRGVSAAQSRAVRIGFGVVAVGLAAWAITSRRSQVIDALHRMQGQWLLAAALATLGNLLFTGLAWREVLADLGSRLPLRPSTRIFFVGQIGKYIPGGVWPVVVQAELGRDHGVARRRSAVATLVLMLLAPFSALIVVLACLPFVPAVAHDGFGWTLLLVVPLLVVLHPRVLGRLFDRVLSLLGRPSLGEWTTPRGMASALGLALLSWVGAGMQVFCLAASLGAPRTWHEVALATGGYALAWVAGMVVIIAPAGAGAREVALGAILSTVLDPGAVVVVVLLSRLLFTTGDLVLAGVGLVVGKPRR